MRKIYILLFVLAVSCLPVKAQDTIAGWTFPTGTAVDALANIHSSLNMSSVIATMGGTSAIDYSKNGFTTKAAQATGWDGGSGTKAWLITLNTSGYQNLTISSRQQSGGANPGPKNMKLQYLVDSTGGWIDISNGNITLANDWTTSWVNALNLPAALNNQPNVVLLRWIMTSNDNSSSGTVTATGTSKIDEIYISGTPYNVGIQQVSARQPHAWLSNGRILLENSGHVKWVKLYDVSGRLVSSQNGIELLSPGIKGYYILEVESAGGKMIRQKLLVQ